MDGLSYKKVKRRVMLLFIAGVVSISLVVIISLSGGDRMLSLAPYFIIGSLIVIPTIIFFLTESSIREISKSFQKAEEELIKATNEANSKVQKLEFLTKAIQVGIWERNLQDGTESWSDKLYGIFGYDPGQIPGTFKSFLDHVHPGDRQVLIDAGESSLKTGMPSTIQIRVLNSEGNYKWVEATGNILRDSEGKISLMMGGIIDINDRKVLENQLKDFVEYAPAPIAMFNKNMEYVAVSRKWLTDYHIEDQLIIGESHYKVFPEIGEEWKEIHRRAQTGSIERRDEDLFVRADGSIQWIQWEIRPWYVNDNEVGGIIMFTQDITELKMKTEELKQAKETAEAATRVKQEFLATMSHEIRTPLNAIIGLSHLLMELDTTPQQYEYLKLLQFSGQNLLNLINDILDIGKIESGKLQLECVSFDLHDTIENIKGSLMFQAKDNNVHIITEYDRTLPRILYGDPTRINQIIFNLAGNAVKFSKKGKVWITVKNLSSVGKSHTMRISVKDTGIGIAPQNIDKIFNSFEQAESGTSRKYGGTGLGLFIVKNILELMGSRIEVESKVGEGSEFYFYLTLEEGMLKESTRAVPASEVTDKKVHVLIAEDNAANQLILKKYLDRLGITYDLAGNGAEVCDLVMSKRYDLVLMDIRMPVLDGFEASKRIRSMRDTYFKNLPIIALTADSFSAVKEKNGNDLIDDFLSKPFNPVQLQDILKRYSGKVLKVADVLSSMSGIIDEYAQNDEAFKIEFCSSAINSYVEFISEFNAATDSSDDHRFFLAIQKIQSLNSLLNQVSFKEWLESIKDRPLGELREVQGEIATRSKAIMKSLKLIGKL